ncbi:MAG TPA: M48 family metallopeptidase, partial [Fibrobacteria bacterium]|nr:M48 family metallopeptidase [Fibrobacteria bacterium]
MYLDAESTQAVAGMGPDSLLGVFLGLFAANLGLELVLNLLNRREVLRHREPPSAFADHFDASTYARCRAYTLDRLAFARVSTFWSAAILLVLLLSGVLPRLDAFLARLLGDGPARGAAFLAAIFLVQSLFDIPLSAWATFRLEGAHGFNRMTWGLYWKDLARGALLSAALGLPLLYALLWILERAGAGWWLWAFLLVLAVQVAILVLYPVLIAPLFNRFKPLEEGPLKASLLELAATSRFPARDIHVMDGSRRSLHSNAYFTGFGRFRRIVLFDTLVAQMDPRELRCVLAHEIGHYKLGHIVRALVLQSILLLALFWAASLALAWPSLYQAFGFTPPSFVISDTASEAIAAGPVAPGPA